MSTFNIDEAVSHVAQNVLRESRNYNPDGEQVDALDRQVLVLMEEVGEVVQKYRKHTGRARHHATESELETEIADVLISCYVLLELMDGRKGREMADYLVSYKLRVIMDRGGL